MNCLFARAMIVVVLLALLCAPYRASAAEMPDPSKSDPSKSDPSKSDPSKSDPSKSDPSKSDPIKSDPIKSDPSKSDPSKSDPSKSDPSKSDPSKSAGSSSLVFGKEKQYEKAASALFMLFVVAVLLENAFSALFRWKVFLAYFSDGAKIVIMFVASFVVVTAFDLDILAGLVSIFKDQDHGQESGMMSKIVTSLILAGGSAAVFNIMRSLGIRTTIQESEINPQPPPNKAWVAIIVHRKNAVGDIQVKVEQLNNPANQLPSPIAGIIRAERPPIFSLIFRGRNRFPQNGGYEVTPGLAYKITVDAREANGNLIDTTSILSKEYAFAPGAIVDFTLTL